MQIVINVAEFYTEKQNGTWSTKYVLDAHSLNREVAMQLSVRYWDSYIGASRDEHYIDISYDNRQ